MRYRILNYYEDDGMPIFRKMGIVKQNIKNGKQMIGGSVWGSNPPETYSCPSTDLKSAEPTGTQPLPSTTEV